jgi:leucyl-tRNA synthetase
VDLDARQISWSPLGGAKFPPRAIAITQVAARACHELLRQGGREAQLICRAPEVFMQTQSRQYRKFQSLLAGRAQFMRHNPTDTERSLWFQLSGKKLGVAFKRQVVVDRFVVDYLAPSVRLIVEVDGLYHLRRVSADAGRDRVLQRLGYRVLRLEAELIRCNLVEAVGRVRLALALP